MPSVISAGTASNTALTLSSDTSGELQLKTNNGSTTALTLTTGGNINIPTAGARITGDFSNATIANRVAFQTSTTNDNTFIPVLANGTGTITGIELLNGSDATNASVLQLSSRATEARIAAPIRGTGTYVPLTFFTAAGERLRIDTSGNVGIGTSSPQSLLEVSQSNATAYDSANMLTSGQWQRITNSNTTSGNAALLFFNPNSSWSGIAGINTGTNSGALAFGTRNAGGNLTERMRITSGGNVGIGTNNPVLGLLDINGASATLAVRTPDTTSPTLALFVNSGSNGVGTISVDNGGIMTFDTGSTGAGQAERMRIDSSGNVGIGTSSPSQKLHISGGNVLLTGSYAASQTNQFQITNGQTISGATGYGTALQLLSDGSGNYRGAIQNVAGGVANEVMSFNGANVGIGTSSPNSNGGANATVCHINNSGVGNWAVNHYTTGSTGSNAADGLIVGAIGSDAYFFNYENANMLFATNNTERMRITSGGEVLIGTTNTSVTAGVGVKVTTLTGALVHAVVVDSTSGTGVSNYHHYNVNATFNGYRFYVKNNGGIDNFSANNTNLSDERVKTNIELAGNYLNKICSIPVKVFNYKDEPTGEQRSLGVIAQDVEAVAPELISNDGWLGKDEFDTPLKSVYETDMMFALMKCIQEQQAMIEELKQEVAALKAK